MATYNGYTNYPTWNVSLWIENDEYLSETLAVMANRAVRVHAERVRVSRFSDEVKQWAEEMAPELGASMFSDMLGWAMQQVNWSEIAKNALDEVEGDTEEDEDA